MLPQLTDVMWTTGQPVVHVDAGNDPLARPGLPCLGRRHRAHRLVRVPGALERRLEDWSSRQGTARRPRWVRDAIPAEHEPRVRDFLREQLPALADAPIRESRLCLYCDTFDGDFWIDHDPDRPGLIVAAGDSGHGFKFAPILGALIADVVERRPNHWAPRFRWRSRGPDEERRHGRRCSFEQLSAIKSSATDS